MDTHVSCDLAIVGAGLAGAHCAYELRRTLPGLSVAVRRVLRELRARSRIP